MAPPENNKRDWSLISILIAVIINVATIAASWGSLNQQISTIKSDISDIKSERTAVRLAEFEIRIRQLEARIQ
jgi:hypothetical protein